MGTTIRVMLLALMPVCALAVDWENECIAEYDNYRYKIWSRLDTDYDWNGDDHIVWVDGDNVGWDRYIYYTYLPNPRGGNPAQGFTELVDSGPFVTAVAIAVDRNVDPPVPYILYSDGENPAHHVRLASRVGGIWTSEIVRTFPEDPGEPYEVGDEIYHRIMCCGLAVGNDHSVHAAYDDWFMILAGISPKGVEDWDVVRDVAYATKPLGGTWELTNWLGTREIWNDPNKRNKYPQKGPDVVLGSSDEPYVSFCEHEYYCKYEPSYIFIATTDGSGEWFYEQALEMDKLGDSWFYTDNTSLADKAPEGAVEPELHLAYIAQNGNPEGGLGPARTYYVSHDGVDWDKELVYEYPMNTPVFDTEVLYGNYGPGVAFGEYGGGWPDATVYAALYARDPSGNWVNIMPVDRTALSGNSITAAVKPEGYTDVFYAWGYTEQGYGGGEDALLWAAFELPGLDFTSGPGGESLAIKPELARVFTAPNPASDVLNLKFELSCPGKVKVSTYDIAGRKIHATVCEGAAGENTLRIPVAEWPRGVYIYRVVSGESCKTGKAVVSR